MGFNEFVLTNELPIRLGFFFGVFAVMALWEILSPRRRLQTSKAVRWANNLGLVFLNSFVLRFAFPAAAVGMALQASERGWGLFNVIEAPYWAAVLLSVMALDFFIWLQHVMVHAIPVLWRLHRVHHADLDFDVTTGARFHTLEILLSMLIKFAVILLLGPPLAAVVLFEVLLNATAMFNHGNVRLPARPRPGAAPHRGDAGHAPRASLRRGRRDQQQLRLQPAVVGPPVRDLPRATARRARGHDHRHPHLPHGHLVQLAARHARDSLRRQGAGLCHQPPPMGEGA